MRRQLRSFQFASQLAALVGWVDTPSRPRGAFRPSFASSSTLIAKRAQGRPGADGTHDLLCEGNEGKPHSSIQVKPNTRPSLRDGRTAYAVLSREPNSFWPPSPQRKSPAPRRLTQMPHPPGLDRSNDGQDHTVLPYARPVGATGSDGVVHVAIGIWRDKPDSAVRQREALGSRRAVRPALSFRARRCCVHRKPGSTITRHMTAPQG